MAIFTWITVLSAVTFIVSLLAIPWLIGSLSPDCFLRLSRKKQVLTPFSPWRILLTGLQNILGLLLLFAGIAMLFLPGQGLLTIIIGALLLSFPGKQKLIGALVSRPGMQRSMDWIRKKRKKPPFLWPGRDSVSTNNS